MPSPFEAALAKADLAIDAKMAEEISIIPMLRGDFAEAVDSERPVIDVVALVNYVDPSSADIDKLDGRIAYDEYEIEIRRALLPAGYKVRKNDIVQLLDRHGSPRTKVMRVNEIDPTRLVITLSPVAPE